MQIFILKTLLSFIIGGVWITGTTQFAEKFGTRIGGFVGGLPSTIVVSLFFIAWTEGPARAYDAASIVPYALTGNVIFLLVYVIFARRGVVRALMIALVVWSLAQFVFIKVASTSFLPGFLFSIVAVGLAYLFISHQLGVQALSGIKVRWDVGKILVRALLGGSVVAIAIILSRISGALLAGIFAVFPAVAISTMWFSYRSGGVEFSRSIVPAFILSMVINCGVYAYIFRALVLERPLILTSLLAYIASMGSGLIIALYASYTRGSLIRRAN